MLQFADEGYYKNFDKALWNDKHLYNPKKLVQLFIKIY